MATGDTKLKICNDSLIMLGANIITSFSDGSSAAQITDRLYDDIKVMLLSMYPWSFSMKKVQLARLETLIAGARALFITTSAGGRPVTGWEKIGNKIQTNYESIWIDYQYDVSEDALPQYFVQLLKYFLCWHFAEPVTDQISKSQYWSNMAVGSAMDNGRGGYFRQASMIDSQNQPNQVIEDYSLVAVRY